MIKLHNTLSGKVEEFKPIKKGEVKMYHCGPTVYDYVHIGNLRAFTVADLLRRTFEYLDFKVEQVMNITDVGQLVSDGDEGEDKMTKGLKREGKPITLEAMQELADFYTEKFKEDIGRLNILTPHELPKASENIKEDIELIKVLQEKGFTYKTSDGLYFDTSKDKHYGELGGTSESDTKSRIVSNSEKRNPKDFALWKLNDKIGFPSPWGQGFPGWHIECSAMARKFLGEHFDIHTGGIDLAPIHHNNEIAQSENACGCKFVNYWIHNEFVNVSGEKIAKSEGNSITLNTVVEKGYSPLAYRYFLLLSHYRTKTNFSWEILEAAENAYRRLKTFMLLLEKQITKGEKGKVNEKYKKEFTQALENDLNTPEALAVVWKLAKFAGDDVSYADAKATLLDFDQVLGLNLTHDEYQVKNTPTKVEKLLEEREQARTDKDWTKADKIREEIKQQGFDLEDTDQGPKLSKI